MTELYNKHLFREMRREFRHESTVAEKRFWQLVRGSALGVRVRRQFGIAGYIADFYIPEYRIAIEIDGAVHNDSEVSHHDAIRQSIIESFHIHVIRFTNDEVFLRSSSVLARLHAAIASLPRRPPSPYEGEG